MSDGASVSTLTPTIAYDDLAAALGWLTGVLGFTATAVYDGPGGGPFFAQLVWRTGVVFVSARPPRDNPWSGTGPASIALAAENTDAVDRIFDRAVAAAVDIVRPVHVARTPMFPEGSRQFDLRDPEGNLWTIGTFAPRVP